MATFSKSEISIAELIRLRDEDQIVIRPKFQRRDVWSDDAKSYLVDTVLRQLPMPKFYFRRIVHPEKSFKAFEIVVG